MKCSLCDNQASFICKFCGRIICENHRHLKPFILSVYDEDNDSPKAMVVEDAAWCGKCHPTSSPITLSELE